ncbi:MAG TPA: enoyl-CoA hydratase-related protein, partial [Alphaproteobacteria bacterium]|nr:enoyl-CoA hydratase-related protein [Alphaproteobacteria bacterium]
PAREKDNGEEAGPTEDRDQGKDVRATMDETVLLQRDGAVAEIAFNRPKSKNSLRPEDLALLASHLDAVRRSNARCLVLRGEGGAFSAGRDIAGADPVKDDNEGLLKDIINPVVKRVREFPLPTLALVEGPCLGIGFGLAFACDITLAAEDAVLGSPFRNIGCILDSGGHHVMASRIGSHRTFELIYTGRLISGREAAEIGLINRAYAATDLIAEGRKMAAQIASGPTEAFRISKRILLSDASFDEVLDMEAEGQAEALRTADGVEGFKAFQEKRRPVFRGK